MLQSPIFFINQVSICHNQMSVSGTCIYSTDLLVYSIFFFFFLAVLGLLAAHGASLVAVHGLLIVVASLIVEHGL